MKINDLYLAEVKQNDSRGDIGSPKADGRVQIYVEPIMKGWKELPWARPFMSIPGMSWIPSKGDKLWVFCLRPAIFKDWYYIGLAEFPGSNPHNDIQTFAGKAFSYPSYRYIKLPNGNMIVLGADQSNTEIAIEHKSGTYIIIDNDGNVEVNGGDVTITADKAIIDSSDITLGQNGGKVLTTVSDPVVDNITGAPHVGSSIIKGQ